jgi:3-hexulose-6-phosphate synthase/6-phospho-3-hexuloisomerase
VFARSVVPNAGGAEYPGQIGVAVNCAGQVVRPGDWIVGDEDGVVVVPSESAAQVLAGAEKIAAAEKEIERGIRSGAEVADLIGAEALLEQKRASVLAPQLRARREGRRR